MSSPGRTTAVGGGTPEAATILESLEGPLARDAQIAPTIIGLERTRLSSRSSYRTELVTLRFSRGRELRILLKDYGACKHRKEDSLGAGGMVDRRRRELRVYRDLLATARLGTPRYYGAVWDDNRQWFWLLLEYVQGRKLSAFKFEHWLEAAHWLGRMQGRFTGAKLSALDFLVEHDGSFFSSIAEEALRAARAASSRLAARLSSTLSDYDELVAVMSADRSALVHGAYRPYNILVCPQAGHRICVLDWEESARGSPLYDLACLADGFERDAPSFDALVDGYEQEAAAAGLAVPDRDEVRRLIHAFSLHRNLKTLTKAETRSFSLEGITDLVERARALAGLVR
jgi:aminoglycoside phosphotransferase (APT) family kinase protein